MSFLMVLSQHAQFIHSLFMNGQEEKDCSLVVLRQGPGLKLIAAYSFRPSYLVSGRDCLSFLYSDLKI